MVRDSEKLKRGGIYIHVPFCRGKCSYCSFYSVGGLKRIDWKTFAEAVVGEMRLRVSETNGWRNVTIYIGGGTPSMMDVVDLAWMLDCVRESIVSRTGADVMFPEITIEVNPDDVDEHKAKAWRDAGISRVSMGVQSMVDQELKSIGRRHDVSQVHDAYVILRKYFSNISLDMIFGLPGQTLSSLEKTLDEFLRLKPEHISAYSLMYEERSLLTKQLERGEIEEQPENISVEMFSLINARLRDGGYERYEISNYSLPGRRSVHNSSYWEGIPYIGLGPSSHSFDGYGVRRWNHADIKAYNNGRVSYEEEHLSSDERREEMIMTMLRVKEGLDLKRFREEFGEREYERLLKKCGPYIRTGRIVRECDSLCLTDVGVMISDDIVSSLF